MSSITLTPNVSSLLVLFYRRHTACAVNSATAIANRMFTSVAQDYLPWQHPAAKYREIIADKLS